MRLLVLALAACSVPGVALDGKQCPCTGGYTCETATNTCHVTTDAQPGSSCLGAEPPTVFAINFDDGALHLTPGTGTWTASGGQAHQSDAQASLAFAYATSAVPSDYRVAATLIPGTGRLGVAFRVGLGARTMYYCDWDPATGQLALGWTNNGGNPTQLRAVTGPAIAQPVTIHAEARGTNLSCCIDELPAATLMMVPDTRYANGQPGLMTEAGSAAFDDLVVGASPI